jgi:hypothetical protein
MEACSMWTNSVVPARRIGITVLCNLYDAESAQRGNGTQYLRNLLEFGTCVVLLFCLRIKVGYFPVCALYCNNSNNTQNKASTRHSIVYLCIVVNDISYNKCTQQNAWHHLAQKFRNNLPERLRAALSNAAPAIYFSGALRKHIIWADY